jgi:hypothetical protein
MLQATTLQTTAQRKQMGPAVRCWKRGQAATAN